nr:MAG: hypothetical protein 3 [Guangxi cystovirus 7]QYF49774.1 MAG: hypothetical protein 3 [Guangxi cystovirus 15]
MEHNFIAEAMSRTMSDTLATIESYEDSILILPHDGDAEENDYFDVVRIDDDSVAIEVLAKRPTCLALDNSDFSVMVAKLLLHYPELLKRKVKVLEDYPGQVRAEEVFSILGLLPRVSYLRFASDVDHERTMRQMMTEEELALNKSAMETSMRSGKDGAVKELVDFDISKEPDAGIEEVDVDD